MAVARSAPARVNVYNSLGNSFNERRRQHEYGKYIGNAVERRLPNVKPTTGGPRCSAVRLKIEKFAARSIRQYIVVQPARTAFEQAGW